MTEDERIEIIRNALAKEYRGIWDWEPTPITQIDGPEDLFKVAKFNTRVREMREACVEALCDLSDDELRKIRDYGRGSNEISIWPWSELLPESLHPERLLKQLPPIWAYGFGHPAFRADFDYWVKMPNLSLMEATLLSVGAHPETLTSDDVYSLKKENHNELWASLRFLILRYDLLFRVFPPAPLGKEQMSTEHLYNWIKEVDLEVHPGFREALSRRFGESDHAIVAAEATPTEKVSLMKLVAAMAIEQYGYDPSAQKNAAVNALCDDLDGLGIGLDPKTVRKWLKEACALIDPEYLPK